MSKALEWILVSKLFLRMILLTFPKLFSKATQFGKHFLENILFQKLHILVDTELHYIEIVTTFKVQKQRYSIAYSKEP